jgi:hypothetical protein
MMKRRSDPNTCPRCRKRVPRSAARCPWCLDLGVDSDKSKLAKAEVA